MRAIRVAMNIAAITLALGACARQGGDPDAIQTASNAASCLDRCGNSSSDGSCYCDDTCKDYGDCCNDFSDACSDGSGAGGSGGGPKTQPSGGAAGAAGAANSGGAGGSGGSQEGPGCDPSLCNTHDPGKAGSLDCYCDSSCIVYGDCCANKTAVCGS